MTDRYPRIVWAGLAALQLVTLSCAAPPPPEGGNTAAPASTSPPDPGDATAFQFDATWPKPLPDNWTLGNVVGVAVDARDDIWVIHRPGSLTTQEAGAAADPPLAECCRAAPPVIEFNQAGDVVQAWGGPGEGYEWPEAEHGIFVDHLDNVWIGGSGGNDSQILKFTQAGDFLLQIGRQGQGQGSNDLENFGQPAEIDLDPETNEVFIADGYGNRRVAVFDGATGEYKRHWGAYGNTPTDDAYTYDPDAPLSPQFGRPVHCATIARDGLVYVCDRVNDRIQVFRKDGTYVDEVVVAPRTRAFGSAFDVDFSRDAEQRYLYNIDGMNQKVWLLNRATLEILGSFGFGGHVAGGFTAAHSLAVDSSGSIYIGETLEGKRVQRFVLGQ
ncbi:MAG: hypothetical protein O3A25_09855 [Acidobacteria bacterium]|nr:hypothetical protein [Acidobacteriota bacterium]